MKTLTSTQQISTITLAIHVKQAIVKIVIKYIQSICECYQIRPASNKLKIPAIYCFYLGACIYQSPIDRDYESASHDQKMADYTDRQAHR